MRAKPSSFPCTIWVKSLAAVGVLTHFVLWTGAAECQEIYYGTGNWDASLWGNHRAVVRVIEKSDAVWVRIPWRRRDAHPENKDVAIVDARSGQEVANLFRLEVNREFGDLIFQPQTVPGDYYVYYLRYQVSGRPNYPTVTYSPPLKRAAPLWLKMNRIVPLENARVLRQQLPIAKFVQIQSVDGFHSFDPMEVIATSNEVKSFLTSHPRDSYFLFPEDRAFPIRMTGDLPWRWMESNLHKQFQAKVAQGEYLAFQIGVFAARQPITDLGVVFTELKALSGTASIPPSALTCFNTGGVDWEGKEFRKRVRIDKGKVQALWFGIQVPEILPPGRYEGMVTLKPAAASPQDVNIALDVSGEVLKDAGDSEPWRHSRLRWLDSKLAADDSVVPPFTPLEVQGTTIKCLGREVTINRDGFPAAIVSMFSPAITHLETRGRNILSGPVRFSVEDSQGNSLSWGGAASKFVKQTNGTVAWEAIRSAGPVRMHCQAEMEFDGNIEYQVQLTSARTLQVKDIRLEIPLRREVARYMMGMGFKGGLRPLQFRWKWDQRNNQDSVWVGDVNAGLQCSLKAENYVRPLNTNFYLLKPLNMPPSWYNEGAGGCDLLEDAPESFLIKAYSGPRSVGPGRTLHFNFRLMITPFKLLDTKGQWSTRYYHAFKPVDEIAASGANTVNVHHANAINPFINYPFLRSREMKAYVDEAHQKGLKVKIYYTVRELSNRAPELFALRSLGDEIFSPGPGGGYSWLQEHLLSDYIAAWFVPELQDAALINNGVSRWHNYYVEGLNWLVQNVGIDGLYIDDVAFDRTTMKRVRRVLDRGRKGALIDLHSANQFNSRDGYANSTNLYLEHFPYLNRLWFGEYFDYNAPPDYWLVELSGVPFGLMGEMLQDGGNPWRGMLFGMTSRLPWAGDPTPIWSVWDAFGIEDSNMIGFWVPDCPVKTTHPGVLATAYVRDHRVLISVASWAKESVRCRLSIDWDSLRLDPRKSVLSAPAIKNFQSSSFFAPSDEIPIPPGKGWLLILGEDIDRVQGAGELPNERTP